MSERKYFGTDGMRGVANVHPMTCELVTRMGMAIAERLKTPGRPTRIVIGKDTRLSGYMFESALAAGIVAMGADVWLTGPLPTPGIAFITSSMRADAGVVISASHNPFEDNGIKLFSRDGYKLGDALELEIEALMDDPGLAERAAPAGDIGYATRIDDAVGRYVVFCKSTFPKELTLDSFTVVVDSAHGAGYRVAPAVFEELGARVISIGDRPNGKNINQAAGALAPETMCARVTEEGADFGVALDGDGDRLVMCDERGVLVDGDAVMALCATRMLSAGELRDNTVVATVMSNLGFENAIRAAGGRVVRTQVGDRYVVEEMRSNGYNFGGEQSGHLVFLDHMTTGDGIIAALAVAGVMAREDKPLSALAQVMERIPQVTLSVPVAEKRPLEELGGVRRLMTEIERELGDSGRLLVRYSGTENKARVMIEGPDEAMIRARAESVAAELRRACAR